MTGDLIQITKGPQGPAGAPGAPGAVWSPRNGRETPRLGAMPVFHPGSLGIFVCNLSICSIFFKWVTRLVTSTLSHLDVFRCCVILFLIMITPWCFQFFTSHQSSSSHWSFDVQDGESDVSDFSQSPVIIKPWELWCTGWWEGKTWSSWSSSRACGQPDRWDWWVWWELNQYVPSLQIEKWNFIFPGNLQLWRKVTPQERIRD